MFSGSVQLTFLVSLVYSCDNTECDRLCGEKATTSLTSPTKIIVSVELQQFSDPEYDPAYYFHENLTETNREMLIFKGPAYFQNKDYDSSDTSRTYKKANDSRDRIEIPRQKKSLDTSNK